MFTNWASPNLKLLFERHSLLGNETSQRLLAKHLPLKGTDSEYIKNSHSSIRR